MCCSWHAWGEFLRHQLPLSYASECAQQLMRACLLHSRPHSRPLFCSQVGRIIGKAGVTIKELEGRTGVRVQVDHKAGTEQKPVHLIGQAAAVEMCKTLVHEVLVSESGSLPSGGETIRKVSCPPGIVGRIIGRGGETIRSLQSGSGAHILVDQVRGSPAWLVLSRGDPRSTCQQPECLPQVPRAKVMLFAWCKNAILTGDNRL